MIKTVDRTCLMCYSPIRQLLGVLGYQVKVKCRACGWEYTAAVIEGDDTDIADLYEYLDQPAAACEPPD